MSDDQLRSPAPPVLGQFLSDRRLLVVGVGGTGKQDGNDTLSWLLRLHGQIPDSVRVVVVDVDRALEGRTVRTPEGREVQVPLRAGVEFIEAGEDLDLPRLAREVTKAPSSYGKLTLG